MNSDFSDSTCPSDALRDNSGDNDRLDGALRAAFGRPAAAPTLTQGGVLASLQRRYGVTSHVLLRDSDEGAAVIKPAARELIRGSSVESRYQVLGEIARGGVGVVYKGRDVDLGRDVAMKVLRPDLTGNATMVRRFVEEAQIAGQLQHPGILPVYELGLQDEQAPYFTMKLVKGQTLAALLHQRTNPQQDHERMLTIFEQVCQSLAYAHSKGVIHRDLKPSNIMVGPFGEVHVVDWGLAKVLQQGGLADERLADDESMIETVRSRAVDAHSQVGSVMGTPAYMSPEQARGEVGRLDERCDVFSLGAILLEILTGQPPYSGDRASVLRQAASADLAEAEQRLARSGAADDLAGLVRRCLARDLQSRPLNAGVVAAEIAAHRQSLDARARAGELAAAEARTRVVEERRRRRLTLVLAGVVLTAVIGVAGSYTYVQQSEQTRRERVTAAVNREIEEAAVLLGQAAAAQVGERQPWSAARTAIERLESRLADEEVQSETRMRASELRERFTRAEQDRRFTELIEEVVIQCATHDDRESWKQMETDLRQAFQTYGIDLAQPDRQAIADRIRASELGAQLADGLELWIATRAHLMSMGERDSITELLGWVKVLYAADPDPFSTRVRQMLYAEQPDREVLLEMVASADYVNNRPRALSWLAAACYRTGDLNAVDEVLRRTMRHHPQDFMLNFDYAYNLTAMKRWEEAVRYYMRCLVLRPHSSGVWRALGNALRELGDLDGSLDALRESLSQQDHAATHVDLARTLRAASKTDEARAELEAALKLRPGLESAVKELEGL